jgi:hypothetical protein
VRQGCFTVPGDVTEHTEIPEKNKSLTWEVEGQLGDCFRTSNRLLKKYFEWFDKLTTNG